jgi:diguanylate cyclase (GGDEF)-like protein
MKLNKRCSLLGANSMGISNDMPGTSSQDTMYVRMAFRGMIQWMILVMVVACLLHALMFYLTGEGVWIWGCAIALMGIPMHWMTAIARPFPLFLAGVGLVLGTVITYVSLLTNRFGEEAEFHLLLLIIVPVIMVSGRISVFVKWILVLVLATYMLSLDHSFQVLWWQVVSQTLLHQRTMHVINIAAVVVLLAFVASHYFLIVVRMQDQLMKLASTDPLTGLNNRRRLTEVAELELAKSRRYNLSLSVIVCDLDHFKAVNDRLGHDGGDAVLRHASEVISQMARETDTTCRWGGEEFLMLLPNTDHAGATNVAERIRKLMADTPVTIASQTVNVTLTLGVASLGPGETLEAVIGRADAALYAGKLAGRNRVTSSTA